MNNITLVFNQDIDFKLLTTGAIQGDDLIIKVIDLPTGYNLLNWSWKNTVEPAFLNGIQNWDTSTQIQGDSSTTGGTSVVFNPLWDDSDVTTRFATVTVPLLYPDNRNPNFSLGDSYSFIYEQGTGLAQVVFTINDINPAGGSGTLPIPTGGAVQPRFLKTVGKNDISADYNTADYASDTVTIQTALNSSPNLTLYFKNSDPDSNQQTTYNITTLALKTNKNLRITGDKGVVIKQVAGTNQNMFNNYDFTTGAPYTFNFLDYFEVNNITFDRNSDNQTIKNFVTFNLNTDTAAFPDTYGKGPQGHGNLIFRDLTLNNNGWNDYESQELGSGQSPIHVRSADTVIIENVQGDNNDALFSISRVNNLYAKNIVTTNFYFDSIYFNLCKNAYVENISGYGEGTSIGAYNNQNVTVRNLEIKPILYTVTQVDSTTQFRASSLPSTDNNRYGGAKTAFGGAFNKHTSVFWQGGDNANTLGLSIDYVGSTKQITLKTAPSNPIQVGDTFYLGGRKILIGDEQGITSKSLDYVLDNINVYYPVNITASTGEVQNVGAFRVSSNAENIKVNNLKVIKAFSYGFENSGLNTIATNIEIGNSGLSGAKVNTPMVFEGVTVLKNNGFRGVDDQEGVRIINAQKVFFNRLIANNNRRGIQSFSSDFTVIDSGDLSNNSVAPSALSGVNNKVSTQVIT